MNLNSDNQLSTANSNQTSKPKRSISLPLILVVPFVLQIFAAVGITGYLSFRNGQKAVNDLANQLEEKIGNDIEHNVLNYLEKHQHFHQSVIAGINSNNINIKNFQSLESYFWHQMQGDLLSDIFFANVQGEMIGIRRLKNGNISLRIKDSFTGSYRHKYILDKQGNRTKLIQNKKYNTFARPWYQTAIEAGKPTWSRMYSSSDLSIPEISAIVPIYSETDELVGVLGSELTLEHINNFLQNLQIGQSGQAFIMERNGELVASSTPEPIFTIVNGAEQRIFAQNSQRQLIPLWLHPFAQSSLGSLPNQYL